MIDSWDGNAYGPDYFDVSADGVRLFHESFANYSAAADYQTYHNGTGSATLWVVPTLTGITGRPGGESYFDLLGSGFAEGTETITVGGVTVARPVQRQLLLCELRRGRDGVAQQRPAAGPAQRP